MAYIFIKNLDGGSEVDEDIQLAVVNIVKDTVIYNVAGFASNASAAAIVVSTVIGVVTESVDNSGGSVGDLSAQINVNPSAVLEAPSSGTLAQSQVWTSVTMDAVTNFDEDDASTTGTGVIQIRKFISTSKGQVRLNFFAPSDS